MGLTWASYYQLARVNGAGPETKNYQVLDGNWQAASLLFKRFEAHHHNASTPMRYPGYNTLNPATPATPLLSLASTGGSIQAGVTIGIRLSFVDQYGLETEASPETFIQTPAAVLRANAPVAGAPTTTPVPGALPGGTYVYGITKRLGTGESQLSDITTVDVPLTTTSTSSYTVPLTFDPISLYTDGTDSLCLYRSTGFDTNFTLLSIFTATPGLQNNVTTYTDDGTVANSQQQPPQASEFGKTNLLTVDWTTLNIPSSAYRFRVYLTQQAGVWGYQNLFQDYLLVNPTTPFPNNVLYQGTEALTLGFPYDYTQIPFGAPLINLTTEAVGAPIYTTTANASGYQTLNFVFPIGSANSTPLYGAAYVDPNGQFKIALSTPSGANNPALYTTVAAVGAGYAHPTVESGGHPASRIQGANQVGGPTQDLLNNLFSTPVAGPSQLYRKQATTIYKFTSTPTDLVTSQGDGNFRTLGDLTTSANFPNISPDFAGQWFEVSFGSVFILSAGTSSGNFIQAALFINGVEMNETASNLSQVGVGTANGSLSFAWATPITRNNNTFDIRWKTTQPGSAISYGGNVVGVAPQRYLYVKELW